MSGIIGTLGGNSAKSDRDTQLSTQKAGENVFNFAIPAGETASKSGDTSLSQAGDYWGKILSGNRAAVGAAAAPAVNAAEDRNDATRKNLVASGTARGGGVNATSQTQQTKTMSDIDNAIFGARGTAADETAKIGGEQSAEAGNLLGLGAGTATSLTNSAIASRKSSQQIHDNAVNAVSGTLDEALKLIFA